MNRNYIVVGTFMYTVYPTGYDIESKPNFHGVINSLTLRRLMSYIYGAPILDVSRSHSTTQHSR